jgi:hypothetical protein
LKRVHGDLELVATPLPYHGGFVQPGQNAIFMVDFKAPSKAGNFLSTFRLVHGDNIEFGDKASIDIEVKNHPVAEVPLLSFSNVFDEPVENPVKVEEPVKVDEPNKVVEPVVEEQKVSDKDIAMMRS